MQHQRLPEAANQAAGLGDQSKQAGRVRSTLSLRHSVFCLRVQKRTCMMLQQKYNVFEHPLCTVGCLLFLCPCTVEAARSLAFGHCACNSRYVSVCMHSSRCACMMHDGTHIQGILLGRRMDTDLSLDSLEALRFVHLENCKLKEVTLEQQHLL